MMFRDLGQFEMLRAF